MAKGKKKDKNELNEMKKYLFVAMPTCAKCIKFFSFKFNTDWFAISRMSFKRQIDSTRIFNVDVFVATNRTCCHLKTILKYE